jgi:hypothetical protein
MRLTVSALSRSGVLNAKETAAFDTPAARATSAIVVRRIACSTNTSTVTVVRRPGMGPRWRPPCMIGAETGKTV